MYLLVGDIWPQYSQKLALLDKSYKEKEKFDDISDNFDFKINVFNDKCRQTGLPTSVQIVGASIMLFGKILSYFYTNAGSVTSFYEFYTRMKSFFEGFKWQWLNLTKWQTLTLNDIIAANPTLSIEECLWKLYI